MLSWTVNKARDTYAIAQWGDGYFDVNAEGHVTVRCGDGELDMLTLTGRLVDVGLGMPVLVRFVDILTDRVERLCTGFDDAISAAGYAGHFHPLYPIKVNQQRSVVETLLTERRVGLEAGSKPELVVAMALSRAGGQVVCNGYKDREYMRLALSGQRLGLQTCIVLEKPGDLDLVLEEARQMDLQPQLGVRLRLSSLGEGNWQNTGGERSKFGLSAQQVLSVVEQLRALDMLDCLTLLHFHMGSQISNVRDIQRGVHEGARVYAELRELGAPITRLDVGGGLAVDYEGSRSRSFCSMNYDPNEYARAIVNGIAEVCSVAGHPQPDILTEAGRAMTAHHAVLITDVIDTERMPEHVPDAPADDDPELLKRLWAEYQAADQRSPRELVHEAEYHLTEAQGMYVHGTLNMEQRGRVDTLHYALCRRALERLQPDRRSDRELMDSLRLKLADKYFCNFSIFQSIPDVWAIDQVFPIVPLQRLDEEPDRRAVLKDLTCDSDGRIDRYAEAGSVEETLPVHSVGRDERYLLGVFLVGAYQETLGDIHNLFGDTHSVDVHVDAGGIRLDNVTRGEPAECLLASVGYSNNDLIEAYRQRIASSGLSDAEGAALFELLRQGLSGYTYLER